jgi:hypothetical protein
MKSKSENVNNQMSEADKLKEQRGIATLIVIVAAIFLVTLGIRLGDYFTNL